MVNCDIEQEHVCALLFLGMGIRLTPRPVEKFEGHVGELVPGTRSPYFLGRAKCDGAESERASLANVQCTHTSERTPWHDSSSTVRQRS